MKYVRLRLTQDPSVRHPMHQFVVEHDGFEASRLLHVNVDDGGEHTMLFHVDGYPPEPYEAALRERERTEYELSTCPDRTFYLYVREEPSDHGARFVDAFRQTGLIVVLPVEYRQDGTVRLTLVGPSETVQRSLDDVPAGIGVDVRSVGEYDARHLATGGTLTERQYEAVAAAVDCGYYAEPRDGSVADVADALECSPSTAAEHLRRAEAAVMADLVADGA